jgi:hypothetical protein
MRKLIVTLAILMTTNVFAKTTYYSDGSSSSQIGNTTYFSNGESATQLGNTTYFSDGSSATYF